ncbi:MULTISPECIES: sugar MFS transporter [unclassified Chryseobacterium]|uniref:MFS transporter n=1 Tax=unclassified Chryseobacterium TaxID=2593645 RepID=UPI0012C89289|nr:MULTISPECIES: MFS transporter [unclassified Chryseobacterium]MPS64448.1 MFS transporter [Chryseobacterium sp.]UMQ42651.1 MFS transporter [Chryseobacterium sp. Y16C]
MKNFNIKAVLFLNYFVFAILLNSVGTVILQVQQNFGISKSHASVLEGFKDLPIAICSFILASFLPKIGIKNSMLIALLLVSCMCFVMPFASDFWFFKLLFTIVGVSFALIKISVFTSIGLVTNTDKEHSSFMGYLEGFFMIGVLMGNVLFSLFIDDHNPRSTHWLNVYWVLGGVSTLSFLFLFFTKLNEKEAKSEKTDLLGDLRNSASLFGYRKVLFFLLCAFLFVLVEQSFQTWTPTFYKEILKVPTSMSIQAGAVLAGAFALGRFLSGFFSKKFSWIYVVSFCVVGFAISILLVLPLTHNININAETTWLNAPLVVYLFPLMGGLLAPIYPSINSVILASIPKYLHSAMSGLIVVFSAIGGTIGSIITGFVFQEFSGQQAFYLSLIPLSLLIISAIFMNKLKINPKK